MQHSRLFLKATLHEAIFLATCNATMTNKKPFKLQRGCYTQATCLATLRKVEGRSTFLATRNATIAVAKWGVTHEFFLATCNATNVALQVARKIASCNMVFRVQTHYRTRAMYANPCSEATLCRSREKRLEISQNLYSYYLQRTVRHRPTGKRRSPFVVRLVMDANYLYGTSGNFHSGPRSSGGNLYISATGFEGFTDISILTASLVW